MLCLSWSRTLISLYKVSVLIVVLLTTTVGPTPKISQTSGDRKLSIKFFFKSWPLEGTADHQHDYN